MMFAVGALQGSIGVPEKAGVVAVPIGVDDCRAEQGYADIKSCPGLHGAAGAAEWFGIII